ncbi:MAG: DUF1330 domain-containing protein [Steroidobacteraceae bacterium]|jgi:uncharacterized protein (DUF1330 family)|nr:DUF1330 domain-containing protein [Steroidobacteraceae bacterium]
MRIGTKWGWRWLSSGGAAIALAVLLAATARAQQAPPASPQAPEAPRPGYLLVMGTVTDRAALARYAATLGPIYAQYGGRPIANGGVGGKVRVLEGRFPHQSMVLSKFATLDGPNAFWWSPEYRRSVEIRQGAGSFTVVKLKGVPGDTALPEGKPAFLISIAEIRDRDRLKPYAEAAMPLVRAAGAKFLSSGGRKDIELLEGEFGNLTVNVLQFPSVEALRRFYEDPAYQKLIPIRQSAGDYLLLELDAG